MPTKAQTLREKQQAIRDHKEAQQQKEIRARISANPISFFDALLWGSPAFLFGVFVSIIATATMGVTGANYPLIFSAASGVLVTALTARYWVKNHFFVGKWITRKQRFALFCQPFFLGAIATLFIFAMVHSEDVNIFRPVVTALMCLIPIEAYFVLTTGPRRAEIERKK